MSQKNLAQGGVLDNFVDDSEDESNVSTDSDIVLASTSPKTAAVSKHFTPLRLLVVFTFVNVLNYVDRGIVSGAGTTIEGCDAECTSQTDFCWDNVTQRSCGKHYFRKFCSALGQTCAFQFGPDVPMCAGGFATSINDDNCTDPTNLTACPPCCTTQTGFSINTEELGWLQFAFLIGYMPAMLIFGHLVRNHKPFTLMGSGLTIWCCAVLASGFAGPHFFDSYVMLLIARAVSGVGEASFQCIGPPFIDDYAPKAQKGVWLAVFYSAIPCGTALGFVWAGEIAKALSWEYAFIIECPIMLPIAIMCFFIPLDLKNKSGVHGHGAGSHDEVPLDVKVVTEGSINDATADHLLTGAGSGGVDADDFEDDEASYDPYGGVSLGDDDNDLKEGLVDNIYSSAQRKKMRAAMRKKDKQKKKGNGDSVTLWEQIRPVITVPTFLLVTFGYAGYSAVTAGFAFYGPIYVQQSFCEFTQGSADLIFGGIIVVAGLVGTPLGGYVFDLRVCAKDGDSPKRENQNRRTLKALWHMSAEVALGTALCLAAVFVTGPYAFFGLLGIGCIFIFMTTSAVNIATMWTVPSESRPFAIAISTIMIHLLGDVPSPVIIGLLDDTYSPTFALLCTTLWLLWSVLMWAAAWVVWRVHIGTLAKK